MSLSKTEARERAKELLESSIIRARHLHDALKDEYDALAAQDMDALLETANAKSSCVREIQLLDAERVTLCIAAGIDEHADQPMLEFIDWCDPGTDIRALWDELLAIAGDCNSLNLSNGAIVRVRKHQVEQGISVLRGIDPSSPTYDRNGDNRDGLGNRAIAEA